MFTTSGDPLRDRPSVKRPVKPVRAYKAAVWSLYRVDTQGIPEDKNDAAIVRISAGREFAAARFPSPGERGATQIRAWLARALPATVPVELYVVNWLLPLACVRYGRLDRRPAFAAFATYLQHDRDLRCLCTPTLHRLALVQRLGEFLGLEGEDRDLLLV